LLVLFLIGFYEVKLWNKMQELNKEMQDVEWDDYGIWVADRYVRYGDMVRQQNRIQGRVKFTNIRDLCYVCRMPFWNWGISLSHNSQLRIHE
jgi:hypothetical protein